MNKKGKNYKKRNHDSFIEEMREISPAIEIIGHYTKTTDRIDCKCSVCGYKWSPKAYYLLNGAGCKKCGIEKSKGKQRKENDVFVNELLNINPDVIVLEKYQNSNTKIKCECKKCRYIWHISPNNLLHGEACPNCAGKIKNTDIFIKEMEKINPRIQIIGEYVNSRCKIECQCTICGNEWKSEPHSLLRGTGCPECCHIGTSYIEQFIYFSLIHILGEQNVLSRNRTAIGKELDIYIPGLKFAVEPGAWYWHKKKLSKDAEKIELCKQQGIDLVIVYIGVRGEYNGNNNIICIDDDISNNDTQISNLVESLLDRAGISERLSSTEFDSIKEKAGNGSKRIPKDEFVLSIDKNVVVLDKYISNSKEVSCKCKICGYKWKATGYRLLNGSGCAKCKKKTQKTHQEFIAEVKNTNPNVKIIGNYKRSNIAVETKCLICGKRWSALPQVLLNGGGCSKCSGNQKIEQEEFIRKLANINPQIEVIGQYTNMVSAIKCKCKVCGTEWEPIAGNILRHGCKVCSDIIGSKKRSRGIINCETGEKFINAKEAGDKYGVSRQTICSCCNGRIKTAGGYTWKYVN